MDSAFYFVVANSINNWMIDNLKLIYHYPRPYWASANILALECEDDYGYPSGHAMASASIFFLLFLYYFHHYANNYQNNKSTVAYALTFIFGFLLVFAICFSRIYLGVHSID